MNRQVTWTSSLSCYMVILSQNSLTMNCCFFFSFPFFFTFHSLSFQILLDLLCYALEPLQEGILIDVFPHVFPLFLFFFSSLIYRGISSFFFFLSKLSPLIKVRGFWTKTNNWKSLYWAGFAMVVLILGVLGGFARFGGQKAISDLLILKWRFLKPLIKNHLRSFKCEHTKNGWFVEKWQIV